MSLITIIVPVFNEEANISELYARFCQVMKSMPMDSLELLFVDDGSTDRSFAIMKHLSETDSRVKAVRFSRNFGSHIACFAGIVHADGDACGFIAADLQDPPEILPALIKKWQEGYEIVLGVRDADRAASYLEKMITRLYTYLMRKYALENMPLRSADVFLIDKKVMNAVRSIKEKNPNIFGLILWAGFKQIQIPYTKEVRKAGKSKWTFSKKIKIFIDSFVAFSYAPIRLTSGLGIAFATAGFLYAVFTIVNRLFFAQPVEGWASLMVILLIVSGIQLLTLGILGEYLWRNFDETRRRPPFIVSELCGFDFKEDVCQP